MITKEGTSVTEIKKYRIGPVSYTHLDVYKRQTDSSGENQNTTNTKNTSSPLPALIEHRALMI